MPYKRYLAKVRSGLYSSEAIKAILHSSGKVITVQIIAAVLLFVSNYSIIKLSGDKIYGSYVSIMAWISIFSVIVTFGMDDYFVATLPKFYFDASKRSGVLSIFFWALRIVLVVFLVLSLLIWFLIRQNFLDATLQQHRFYFYALLLEAGLLSVVIAFFRGINKIVVGQITDKLIRPGLMLLCIVLAFVLSVPLSLHLILLLQAIVFLIALLYLSFQLSKIFKPFHTPPISFDKTLKANMAFLLISVLYLLSVRLDILFLTKTVLPEQVGHYNIAVRLADMIGYPLAALNLVVPTLLSKEHADNPSAVKAILKNSSGIAFIATLAVYLPAIVLGKYVLAFFGLQFTEGYWPMVLLGGTYLVSSVSHTLNGFLMISGHQHYSLFCLGIHALSVFVFCWWLIPRFGLVGAALSVLLGSILYLALILFVFYKYINEFSLKSHSLKM